MATRVCRVRVPATSIVAGTGVDVDIAPPNTVRVGKTQAEELPGMNNELNTSSASYNGATGAGAKTEESAVAMCSVVAGSVVQSYCNPNNFWRISNVEEAALFI